LSPFAAAVAGLAIAALVLAFAAGHATGASQVSPPTLRPLRAPIGGLVLPHLSQVPALPTLAAPAPKPKQVVLTPRAAPTPPPRRQRAKPRPKQQPKPKPANVTRPAAAAKRVPPPAAPKPVVIVGSG
jgi:outer membrane biosynthesis protein TonB